jgi:hypothetical protein
MFVNKTITKNILENIINRTFLNFGFYIGSCILDSLKLLGLYFGTNSGISLSLEDLKTPLIKKNLLFDTSNNIFKVNRLYQKGYVSEDDKVKEIISNWYTITEELRKQILYFYKYKEPTNSLYIMASSGARGNINQARQLIGLRGLMTNQNGKIITLPIKNNFREGLSSIDYVISSYGARKGIVDTALKTADSGYLTRRLVYFSQEIIIREKDCKTLNGFLYAFKKNNNFQNLLGHYLISIYSLNDIFTYKKSKLIDYLFLQKLIHINPLYLKIRSPLQCSLIGGICQKCYGWNLNIKNSTVLGTPVGIIAAQSIGEPGTQMTMRTFHTGGIFTGINTKEVKALYSGKILLPKKMSNNFVYLNNNKLLLQIKESTSISILHWNGQKFNYLLEKLSLLSNKKFLKKGQIIAHLPAENKSIENKTLKPIYSVYSGEVFLENLFSIHNLNSSYATKNSFVWIKSGLILPIPQESKIKLINKLNTKYAISYFKLVSSYRNICFVKNNIINIITEENGYFQINLNRFYFLDNNLEIKFKSIVKNYQVNEAYSVLGFIYYLPKVQSSIYLIRKKSSSYLNLFIILTKSNIFKVTMDSINTNLKNKKLIRKNIFNTNIKTKQCGIFLYRRGNLLIFQKATPIFINENTLLLYKKYQLIRNNKMFALLINNNSQNKDIVQDLPKIESILENTVVENNSILFEKSGLLINDLYILQKVENSNYIFSNILNNQNISNKTILSKTIHINSNCLKLHNVIFEINLILFSKFLKLPKKHFIKLSLKEHKKLLYNLIKQNSLNTFFTDFLKIKKCNNIYKSVLYDTIILHSNNKIILLKKLLPLNIYKNSIKSIIKDYNFNKIGASLDKGIITSDKLLHVLYNYHLIFDTLITSCVKSISKLQLILLNSLQSIYKTQEINISNIHFEIIIKQMTSQIKILNSGDTPFVNDELVKYSLLEQILFVFDKKAYKLPFFKPTLIGMTKGSIINTNSFITNAGFQETKNILIKAAIEGSKDWLRGLRECLTVGRLASSGTSFLNYKNYLDTIYLFKNSENLNHNK